MSEIPETADDLDDLLSKPTDAAIEVIRQVPGDFVVLGAGGKMGFHISRMVQRCLAELGRSDRIFTVSRFGTASTRRQFIDAGFDVQAADLANPHDVAQLPVAPNAIFLAGVKFGTGGDSALLQRMNVTCPQIVTEHFQQSQFVALSTGCVYSFVTPASGGSAEEAATDPPGEYAQSCLGREGAFAEAAEKYDTRSAIVRLNYSVELRYGVLLDIATRVFHGQPVSLETGFVNVIWQHDAVSHILQCFSLTASPPAIINITGTDVLSVRDLALQFGEIMSQEVRFEGTEQPTAWLNNASRSHELFGAPRTSVDQIIRWTAEWVRQRRETLSKPTHFEVRSGSY